jgi:hypothetical protein
MRIITFGRTVVPLSVVVLALASVSTPPIATRSMIPLAAVGALSLFVLALTRWRHGSRGVARRARPQTIDETDR